MTFGEAIRSCWRQYATFSGRARRSEFWWFLLLVFLGYVATGVVAAVLAGVLATIDATGTASGVAAVLLLLAYVAAVFLPTLAVLVRRLHDGDRTGWWYFISWVPLGSIVLLVLTCLEGTPGPNRYGPPVAPVAGGYGYGYGSYGPAPGA